MLSDDGPVPGLYLLPLDDSFFPPKRIPLPPQVRVRVGRQLNQKSAPSAANGVFESRVLSRQHAEAWVENGRVLIRDVKSSNGTFVNGDRLSPEGVESEPYELRSDDILVGGLFRDASGLLAFAFDLLLARLLLRPGIAVRVHATRSTPSASLAGRRSIAMGRLPRCSVCAGDVNDYASGPLVLSAFDSLWMHAVRAE
ncbi:SMAD/FHA domain-containing protein [Mycena olivaceomarginata]|nr:SMAD/FHA domain-containing protein [Mycena olivaceomarginata]